MKIKANYENLESGISFVEAELIKLNVDAKKIKETLLSLEEVLSISIAKSMPNSDINLKVEKIFGSIKVKIQSLGDPLNKNELKERMQFGDELSPEETIVVETLIERTVGNHIRLKHNKGINKSLIEVKPINTNAPSVVFLMLLLGIVFGLFMKYFFPEQGVAISNNVLVPIYTMFLNALKMIVGPLVFISIANSVMGFDDVKTLGKIAGKVFGLYVFTSAIAIFIGVGTYKLFPIGNAALQNAVTDAAKEQIAAGGEVNTSLSSILVNIVPSDIINPFLQSDMLQILFMGILLGIAVSIVGRGSNFAKLVVDANDIMLKLTNMILIFLPLSNFCAMAKLIINLDKDTLIKLMAWIPVCYSGYFFMIIVYAVLLIVLARMNPLKYFKDISQAMITAFVTCSSNGTMPVTMDVCKNKLKISPKVYAFSIPFGATVNMDGCCITLIITTLFMANSFGFAVSTSMLISLFISIMALSMGSPGVPGGSLVSMTLLFPMVGVPAEAVSIVMGLYCIINMPQTVLNVTGDTVVTTIVAKSENLIGVED